MSLFEQKSLLAKLMATENMMIRQSNVSTASFDVKNRILTVPILDNNLSKDVYDLFMGHECGHALWTPLEGMKKAKEEKVNMSVLNVVEDSRIERKIKNKYPGIRTPFINAYGSLFEKDFFGTEGEDITQFNFIDRANLHCKIGAALALPFNEEERKLLDEIENTESFEEVIEVTKKICDFMKDQLEEMEKRKVKVKVVVHGADGDEESQSFTEGKGDGEDDEVEADVTIHVDAKDLKGESADGDSEGEPGEQDSEGKDGSKAGSGAGRNITPIDDLIRSFTDDAYKNKERELFSKENSEYVYGNIPFYDTSKIMDYKVMLKKCEEEGYTTSNEMFNNYRREASKVVSYLVKEFELRKNADQMKRASIAKTGELNMNRLYSYNFTEDIFKKMTVLPQGKSHGLVMYIDWSGSMLRHLGNTIKQLLNLVMFCKKVNIPFEVYSFIESTDHEYMYSPAAKPDDIYMNGFGLINLLSNRMSASDFTKAASLLLRMGGVGVDSWNHVRLPQFMYLSGTPLNEAIISAFEIVPQFQKRNRLQIVNTVFLTDGEGCSLTQLYDGQGYRGHKRFTHMVLRDPKTRCEEVYDTRAAQSYMAQTDCFLRLLKQRTNSHVIGFFVGETKDVTNRMNYFFPQISNLEKFTDREAFREEVLKKFKKESSLVITTTGYDDYYVLRSNGLDTDDDDELTFKENATTRGMATAFAKYAGNKISSRVVLNRFIGLIS